MMAVSYSTWMLVFALSLGVPLHADAASDAATQTKKVNKRKTVKAPPAVERTPSGETVATRERRLRRECKGRPNAGACLGFAN